MDPYRYAQASNNSDVLRPSLNQTNSKKLVVISVMMMTNAKTGVTIGVCGPTTLVNGHNAATAAMETAINDTTSTNTLPR